MRSGLVVAALLWGSHANGQPMLARHGGAEPGFQVRTFSLPVIDYRAPDGTLKRGSGIIIGRDMAPNATVGLGYFRMKPKAGENPSAPFAGKSRKVAIGVSLDF